MAIAPPVVIASAAKQSQALPSVSPSRRLHSATEAMVYSRCPKKHWFQYTMGLREPAVGRDGPEFGSAVARGQIVHDVLEQLRLEAELDELIDDAVRKWDPDAPPPETPDGSGYRARLRKEIESVAIHPAYREVADLPGARRELAFVHLATPERGWQGAFDLAAKGPEGLILLDVKTGGGARADIGLKARQYGPQRDIYALAAQTVGLEPEAEFRFHFSLAGKQDRQRFSVAERTGLGPALEVLVLRMEGDQPLPTESLEECGHCGFSRIGWCLGPRSG